MACGIQGHSACSGGGRLDVGLSQAEWCMAAAIGIISILMTNTRMFWETPSENKQSQRQRISAPCR